MGSAYEYAIRRPTGWLNLSFMEINNYLSEKEIFEIPSEPFGSNENSLRKGNL